MLLLQGGTQSDLRIDGELVLPISEQGISLYLLNTGVAKGFCSLSNTVSADITDRGVYLCTATQIYFLPIEDISGDSTVSLQLLSITPPNNIVKLCAEKSFLSFISTSDITVVDLTSLVLRTLSLVGVAFLSSYKTYIAFATTSKAYTFCILATTFSLINCYSPVAMNTSFNLDLIDETDNRLLGTGENLRLANIENSTYKGYSTLYFGEFIHRIRMQLSYSCRAANSGWMGFSFHGQVFKYVCLDGLDTVLYHRGGAPQSKYPVIQRPGYWQLNKQLYKLQNEGAVKDTDFVEVPGEFYLEFVANHASNTDIDKAIWMEVITDNGGELLTTKYYFTLPDETDNNFYACTRVGWLETTNKVYGWVAYFHHKDTDPTNTYSEPRLVLCIYNKNTHAVSCTTSTFRSEFLPYLTNQNVEINQRASEVVPFGTAFCFADKRSDNATWTASKVFRKLVVFTVDETTDSFTVITSTDLINKATEFTTCYLYTGETCVFSYTGSLHIQMFRADSLLPITYSITALALGPGLAIADNGVGIHYMGLTGNWKRLFAELEEVSAMSIGSLSVAGDKLAYLTPTASKVIDV